MHGYLFGSPENFLQDKAILDMLKTSTYKERVVALVFDEVHAAVSWGLSAEGKPAFRKFFSEVSDIRALFPAVPMLALTATASQKTREKVRKILALKDAVVFSEFPDRSNIRMCVSSVSRGPDCLNGLVEEIQESTCPQTIIYCRPIWDCSEVYMHFLEALGQSKNVAEHHFAMVLTSDEITNVVENANYMFSVDDLIKLCDVMQYSTACQVVHTFHKFLMMDLDLG